MGWASFECNPEQKKQEVENALNASGFSGLAIPQSRGYDLRLHCKSYPNTPLALAIAAVEPHARNFGTTEDPRAGMGWVGCWTEDPKFPQGRCHHLGDIFIGKLTYRFRCLEKTTGDLRWLKISELKEYMTYNFIEAGEYWLSADDNGQLKIEKVEEKPK